MRAGRHRKKSNKYFHDFDNVIDSFEFVKCWINMEISAVRKCLIERNSRINLQKLIDWHNEYMNVRLWWIAQRWWIKWNIFFVPLEINPLNAIILHLIYVLWCDKRKLHFVEQQMKFDDNKNYNLTTGHCREKKSENRFPYKHFIKTKINCVSKRKLMRILFLWRQSIRSVHAADDGRQMNNTKKQI